MGSGARDQAPAEASRCRSTAGRGLLQRSAPGRSHGLGSRGVSSRPVDPVDREWRSYIRAVREAAGDEEPVFVMAAVGHALGRATGWCLPHALELAAFDPSASLAARRVAAIDPPESLA